MAAPTPPPAPPPPAPSAPTPPPEPGPTAGTNTTTQKTTTIRKRTKISHEALIVIALVVATAELAMVAALGSWQRWLILHGAIAVIVLVIVVAKFRKSGRRRTTGARTVAGQRRGLAGLLGGRSNGAGGRRGLAGLFGGRGHGAGGGHGTWAGTGSGRRRGLGGLLGGSRGTGGGRSAGLFGPDPTDRKRKNKKRGTPDDAAGILAQTIKEIRKGWDGAAHKDKKDAKTDPDQTEDTVPDTEDAADTTDTGPTVKPDTTAGRTQGGNTTMVKTHGAPSLQAWGRCLPSVEAALLEKQREIKRLENELAEIAAGVGRLHDQGDQELPASKRITSILDDVRMSLEKLPQLSEVVGRIAGVANALGALYRTEHATDEDRLAGMRGGVDREKRADVGEAQRDT